MPRSPAKSLTSTAASPPDTSLDPPRDAEEVRSWRNGAWTPYSSPPSTPARSPAARAPAPARPCCAACCSAASAPAACKAAGTTTRPTTDAPTLASTRAPTTSATPASSTCAKPRSSQSWIRGSVGHSTPPPARHDRSPRRQPGPRHPARTGQPPGRDRHLRSEAAPGPGGARLRSRPRRRRPLTADGLDLCEFDGDARLGAPEGAGARPGQPRPGNPAP